VRGQKKLRIESKESIIKEGGRKNDSTSNKKKKRRRKKRKKYWSFDPRLFYIVVVWFGVSNQEPMDAAR
jgi:hypothetical protein